ncbi:ATP-binding cassette domain-containing protein [Candidatus Nomurabacteria bacterium]|nr:ATP-binding cassette domain-containing protein [Candidatus Nomurabacteria bacterium]
MSDKKEAPLIDFQHVTHVTDTGHRALHDVTFSVMPGEFVTFIGHSGAGKSSLLKHLWAEKKPTSGTVVFDGYHVDRLPTYELPLHRRRIGVVFQDYRLLSTKTAFENVAFVLEAMGETDEVIATDVPYALNLVGLGDLMDRFPHQLSDGEQQRVAIARAMVHQPDVLIADEPTGNLDPAATHTVVSILKKINELGTTVLLTTHSKSVVDDIKKRVITLKGGTIVADHTKGTYSIDTDKAALHD